MHCTHNAVFFNPQNCQFLYTNYWLIHFHSWVKKYFCKSRYMYIWPRKNNYLLFFCCLSWPDMTFNKSNYLQNQNSERDCSFFIASATILCGGLDYQDIWVKTSDILPYLYGYVFKKKKIGNSKKILDFFQFCQNFLIFSCFFGHKWLDF